MSLVERGEHPKWSSGYVAAKPQCGRCKHDDHAGRPCPEFRAVSSGDPLRASLDRCKCVRRNEEDE